MGEGSGRSSLDQYWEVGFILRGPGNEIRSGGPEMEGGLSKVEVG